MGKRKYDAEKHDDSKKAKKNYQENTSTVEDVEQSKSQDSSKLQNDQVSSIAHGFDVKHFRKELSTKQGLTTALTHFLQVCLNPDNEVDYLLEYLKCGGNSHEILRQVSQDNKKNLTLATPAFHIFHLIILKVQSSLPHMIAITEEACRYFLNTFMSTAEIMISENSGPRHRKVILKLLTSMVTLNPDLGIEVLNQAPLTPKHLQHIVENINQKEKDNVRIAFVHFIISFLVDGHSPLIKALLEKQGLLGLIFPGLISDDAEAVIMFLDILKKNIIENSLISKSLKLKTFSHQVLHNMFKIYSWKGPPDLSAEVRNESRQEIISLLSEVILTLFTSHKLGLYFSDSSLGTGDANKNQNLYKALLTLKRPWENEHEGKVILEIVFKCPDLHRAIMNTVEHSFEPQHSPIWERCTSFVIKLMEKLKPEEMVPRMSTLSSSQMANFIRFVTLPVPLMKFMQTSIGKDPTVSIYCVKVLVKMLETLRRYIQILDMQDNQAALVDLKNRLEYFFPKHLPTPANIVVLIDKVIERKIETTEKQDYNLPKPSDTDSLIYLLDLLLLYNDIHPTYFETIEGNLNMQKILEFSSTLENNRLAVLKFKIVSLWLTFDSSAISLKNPMFKSLFLIMLEVYTSDTETTWIDAKETLQSFFKNTGIFESDEDEISLMMYTLRNSKINSVNLVADIVEFVIENIKPLTESLRNQIVHFEICDENSESTLDKLFSDLMENRNTEDCVFMENKIPSPFIVGSIQYIEDKKDVKKSLKHFLSLYIVNLLHYNYSPEMTEVLIGDTKLDARDYVTKWIREPTALTDTFVTKDNVVISISKSIIDNEEIALTDVFTSIKNSNEDENDIVIDYTPFKIDMSHVADSSELMIWGKYLIFCTVRLSKMDQLNKDQQRKILNYFDCIISTARKHHMVDVARKLFMSIFKNPSFLKIYMPLNLNKIESRNLASEFIVQILLKYTDIITYLDKRHKLLTPYQRKNCNEIAKAFVKIKKKKYSSNVITKKIMETIGLTVEDDLTVFKQIFDANIMTCVNDDREPSLVLEILSILLEKYSKSVDIELSEHVIKSSVKLYTELLTNAEVTPNLTNIETALDNYFKNKPHQAKLVTEDDFKKFFEANVLRKTTSQLAATLLSFNAKLCEVFKEEMSRPEILKQREITLPLGNAVLNHYKFLKENKDHLLHIYKEYSSNIIKLLEKPHKAGQIYLNNWRFVRELIIECMDLSECKKVLSTNHKFETVEEAHIHWIQTVFLKIYLLQSDKKQDNAISYLLNMLNLFMLALKEATNKAAIKALTSYVINATEIIAITNTNDKEFEKVTNSSIWQNFCKAVLKDSLKINKADKDCTIGPQLLQLLSGLVKILYPENHEDTVNLFDMVTSHSEFLNVMLSHHSTKTKSRLIEFIFNLIKKNKSIMKVQQIPVYLSAYHATRSPCDRLILSVLHYYEVNGLPVNEYKPYVFGESAANHYAVRKNRTSSLWAHPSPNQVLNLFEKDFLERTVRNFPVMQKLEFNYDLPDLSKSSKNPARNFVEEIFKENTTKSVLGYNLAKIKLEKQLEYLKTVDLPSISNTDEDEEIYDPAFLFPLLSHLLAPGSMASCFKLLRWGFLSVPVMALSSHCPAMRAASYHVLHRFCLLLETETKHKNDKLLATDFIDTLRHSLATAINNQKHDEIKNPRLPAIDALYLAKALMVSTAPFDPLYKPVNNFLIAKQFVDLTVVPDFLGLFHDSDIECPERRLWILDIIKNGSKTLTDVRVVFKTMCLKMIMDFYSTVLSDKKAKEKILDIISSLVAVPKAMEILIEGYGIMSWLHFAVRNLNKDDKIVVKSIIKVVNNMFYSLYIDALDKNMSFFKNNNAVKIKNEHSFDRIVDLKTNKDIEHEFLIIVEALVTHVGSLEDEDIISYVELYKMMPKRTLKMISKKQMVIIVSKLCTNLNQDRYLISLLCKAVSTSEPILLSSCAFEATSNCLIKEMCEVVNKYLT